VLYFISEQMFISKGKRGQPQGLRPYEIVFISKGKRGQPQGLRPYEIVFISKGKRGQPQGLRPYEIVFISRGNEERMAEVELQQIGQYSITELLRVSSTSTFYRGKQRKKDILIRHMTAPLATTAAKEAFLMRARQLKKLKNRNIINIIDANFDGDYGYLVMEYVEGETLRQRIAPGTQIAPDMVRLYLSHVAGALHYAHVNNVLHSNLHPGNLIYGPYASVIVTEFALLQPELDDETFAIPYMAPEQLHGQPTPASDQYALGVMAYEWLCGRRPYEATERELLLEQQTKGSIVPLRELNPAISPAIENVVARALAYDPAERYLRIQDFSDHYLSALAGFPVRPTTPIGGKANLSATPANSSIPSAGTALSRPRQPIERFSGHDQAAPAEDTLQPVEQKKAFRQPDDTPPPTPILAPETPVNELPVVAKKPTYTVERRLVASNMTPETAPAISSTPSETPHPTSAAGSALSRPHQPTERFPGHDKAVPEEDNEPEPSPIKQAIFEATGDARLLRTIDKDLRQGGVLSQSLPGYEERPAQIEMATVVARALTERVQAIIEAGTGTGKSLAYLVPVVRSGKVGIISTANKALQEQLYYKDIPFIQKHIKPFEAALVKGMNNYVCLDRVEGERVGMQYFTKNQDFKRLLDIVNDPESDFTGDFETLGFRLPADIRGRVATDSDQCAWSKCSFFGDCYVREMREQAQMAQIIVVNHTLLLLDAAMDGFLLPDRDVIVIDEAHHLEEEATRSFTITISPIQIQTLLAQRMLKDHSQLSLQDEALRAAQAMWMRLEQTIDLGYKGRVNLEEPLQEGLHLATVIGDLADSLRKQRPKDMPDKEGQLYDKLLKRTQNLSENMRIVFGVSQPDRFVYYVDRVESISTRSGFQLQVSAAPLDVTRWLQERLFSKCNVICTSATLATVGPNPANPADKGPNFAYFRKRVGLEAEKYPEVLERVLPLAFDYESNALLYLPRHLPPPAFGNGSDDYMKAIAREMYRLVKISRGRAFLLFSSKRMLDRAYELMEPHLDFPLLKQGDMTRLELTRRFRKEEGAVLFGLKSFWEGVDIAGDALSLVVIDKLPFDPPDDPVHEARVERMKAAGENWFGTYVLPQAVLRLKQGLGRLLRTREDRGVMAILDTRLHTKGYGKMVLNALPPARRSSNIYDVEQFFSYAEK
jgi:Rad3-related DNA helicase/serine/threonine protein kinase